jgi:hypothetical protein
MPSTLPETVTTALGNIRHQIKISLQDATQAEDAKELDTSHCDALTPSLPPVDERGRKHEQGRSHIDQRHLSNALEICVSRLPTPDLQPFHLDTDGEHDLPELGQIRWYIRADSMTVGGYVFAGLNIDQCGAKVVIWSTKMEIQETVQRQPSLSHAGENLASGPLTKEVLIWSQGTLPREAEIGLAPALWRSRATEGTFMEQKDEQSNLEIRLLLRLPGHASLNPSTWEEYVNDRSCLSIHLLVSDRMTECFLQCKNPAPHLSSMRPNSLLLGRRFRW